MHVAMPCGTARSQDISPAAPHARPPPTHVTPHGRAPCARAVATPRPHAPLRTIGPHPHAPALQSPPYLPSDVLLRPRNAPHYAPAFAAPRYAIQPRKPSLAPTLSGPTSSAPHSPISIWGCGERSTGRKEHVKSRFTSHAGGSGKTVAWTSHQHLGQQQRVGGTKR